MTKPEPPSSHWICRYCSLDTGASTNHAGTRDCVAALQREVHRLKDQLRHRPASTTAVSERSSDRAEARAMPADATAASAVDGACGDDRSSLKRVSRLARRQAEGTMIMRMLQQTRGNRWQAAINLGISYKAFRYKAKEHDLPGQKSDVSTRVGPLRQD